MPHVGGMVLACFGMRCPVLATVGLIGRTITLTSLSTHNIIGFGMLGSPGSGVGSPTLFLAIGPTTGALAVAEPWLGFKSLGANTAAASTAVAH
jgi:hypothetical protein